MKDKLTKLIERFSAVRILILGDFILDQFVFGEISRVSREAPVLILNYQDTHSVPGGGANTVANVQSLSAHAIPLGFIGDDESAELLLASWPEALEKRYIFRRSEFRTTRKTRILAGSFHSFRQQVVRMDHEHSLSLGQQHLSQLSESLSQLVPEVDAIVLSDYSLGNVKPHVWETVSQLASQHEKPIIVDSRDNPQAYQGATSITPNITEIEAALSIRIGNDAALLEQVGSRLLTEWQLKALLITRGKLGMSLFSDEGITHIPVHGRDEVVDVTGAGDTVTATYATTLAAGGSFEEAAMLANYAAGIAVMKKGTSTVPQAELRAAVQDDS